jgi:hypothetical protein
VLGLAAGILRSGNQPNPEPAQVTRPAVAANPEPVAQAQPASAPVSRSVTSEAAQSSSSLASLAATPAAAVPAERVEPASTFDDSRAMVTAGRTAPVRMGPAPLMPQSALVAIQDVATARLETPTMFASNIEPEAVPLPPAAAPPAISAVPPAASAAPAPLPPVISGEHDRMAVRALLERYRGAYERLDANAAGETWPSVDRRALAKAFADLSSQTLRFENCDINLGETRGVASCRGLASYVGRVGKRAELAQRQWTFLVQKNGDDWRIDSVKTGTASR